MIQNLKRETGWHLRGTRRIGVSFDDVELIQQCVCLFPLPLSCRLRAWIMFFAVALTLVFSLSLLQIEKVAAFCGLRLTKVPRVADIEHEVNEQA